MLLALAAGAAAPPPDPAALDPSMAQPVPTKLKGYLGPGVLDGRLILGPPPAPDSPQGRADRAIYEETRALAGTPRWKLAQADNDLWSGGALKRYACAMGRDIGERRTPVTLRMIHRVELDVRSVSKPTKDIYDRRRPMLGDDKPICIPRAKWMDTNASYPSGHATTGWVWGLILAEVQPARASALAAAAKEAAYSRVVCGVHYQSDIDAGEKLGAAMVARLHADPAFRADLAKARLELARAPAPGGCGVY